MKQILRALWGLRTIEPLLAFETFTTAGGSYDCGSTLVIKHVDGRQEMALIGDECQTLLDCRQIGNDKLELAPRVPPADMPPDLMGWLRLLGTTYKGPVATGAPIDIEEFSVRVDALRHAYSVLHFSAEVAQDPVDLACSILTHANNLRSTRGALFEAANTATTTASRLAALEKKAAAAREEAMAFAQTLATELAFRFEDDPRGSTLYVTAVKAGRSLYVCGCNLSWNVPAALDWKLSGKKGAVRKSAVASGGPMEPSSRTAVDERVTQALQTAVANGRDLSITEQLDPGTYAKVKSLLGALGGKWIRSRQVHQFDRNAEEVLAQIRGGSVVTDRDWEFFPTPEPVVQRMLAMAGEKLRPGAMVGEPEAGRGALALAAANIVGIESVDCTEAMPLNAQVLRDLGFKVHEGDFLQREPAPRYDVVLMNPPFSNHQDVAHITHALGFLKPGGVLVACASPSWRHAGVAKAQAFRELLARMGAEIEDVASGAFRESGTDVATVLIKLDAPVTAEVKAEAHTKTPLPAPSTQKAKPSATRARPLAPSDQLALSLFDA